jgi:two-component system sensor histidine kinase KdpD
MTDRRMNTLRGEAGAPSATETAGRGKLKIYFGYAPGVGKTYAMLEDARELALSGEDVLVGYVEPYATRETEIMLLGLDLLSTRRVEVAGIESREFDLEAALERHPRLILIDELSHNNAEGTRHVKRWQDVRELLEAGIDVSTTLDLGELESMSGPVAQITGIAARAIVPDEIFDTAADVQIIDIPAEQLLERFRLAKVSIPRRSAEDVQRFFVHDRLTALRELMFRRVADRVSQQRQVAGGRTVVHTRDRLLVCIGPSPTSARVIRAARRMANALNAEWIAACVETPRTENLRRADRERLAQHMQLAERLGAEVATLHGDNVAREVVAYARSRGVTQIIAGKTEYTRGPRWIRRSLVDDLMRRSGDVDVFVIRGKGEPLRPSAPPSRPWWRWLDMIQIAAILGLCTLIGLLFDRLGLALADIVMVYLLGVVVSAARLGILAGVASSIGAVLLFNFFFTAPYHTFHVDNPQYVFTFVVMGLTALATSLAMGRVRRQAEESRRRERRTEALYRLNQQFAATTGLHQLAAAAERYLGEVFGGPVAVLAPNADGQVAPVVSTTMVDWAQSDELAAAQWAHDHRIPAGQGTDTHAGLRCLFVPLARPQGSLGVLGLRLDADEYFSPAQRHLLETFGAQLALAIERDELAARAQRAFLQAEHERLRSALLSSVSHDLRTPLTIITLASSNVLRRPGLDEPARRELQTVVTESQRLTRLVENLLNMTRLEAGDLRVNRQWQPVEETIGSALARVESVLGTRPVKVHQPDELVLAAYDGVLIEQVLVNLLENAAKYAPPTESIEICVRTATRAVDIDVADRGPGIPSGDEERIFEKFYRGEAAADRARGTGLGLAICRAIMIGHGGRISAANRDGGGAVFTLTLPLDEPAPTLKPGAFDEELSRLERDGDEH